MSKPQAKEWYDPVPRKYQPHVDVLLRRLHRRMRAYVLTLIDIAEREHPNRNVLKDPRQIVLLAMQHECEKIAKELQGQLQAEFDLEDMLSDLDIPTSE
ncbi:hypothetical protein [Hymenobacter latericus]|uniref:hypothetical protein n=1 Tax=Hymenobacter sp. YIM 151858-1 TaxID=2987688 RepID=UPI0022277E44|nr:hypothetical protein [Hymenobacter sp. YIM 151858-1]UYZ60078.1 hypothetical protein OIS50_04580 [Hymenobacter sp. YIM 151858-1]